MQSNVKKAKRLKEVNVRDDDPPDTFNYMVRKYPISDDDNDDLSEISLKLEIKLDQDSLCIAENPSNCPNSDECEYVYQSLKCSYNYHMDECDDSWIGRCVIYVSFQ